MMSGLLVGISPAEQVAISPWARRQFQTKWQAPWIKPAGHHYGRNSNHVHPARGAVRPPAEPAVLRHGFVGRRHLCGGVDIAVEMQPVQRTDVHLQGSLPREQDVGGALRICLVYGLRDGMLRRRLFYSP